MSGMWYVLLTCKVRFIVRCLTFSSGKAFTFYCSILVELFTGGFILLTGEVPVFEFI